MTGFEKIAPALGRALAERGYAALTPVQHAMLDDGAGEADLLVSAQTGSGKTVAFGIAIAPTLLGPEDRLGAADTPLALIVAPTRELALQVRRELEWLYAGAEARIASCVGGMDMRSERRALDQGAHIVVGTPGRLRDHITRGSLDISALRAVVLDEADEMLDLGFRDDLEFILSAAPAERRTLMFSATVPQPIAQLAKRFQTNAVRIEAKGEADQHEDIDYRVLLVAPTDKENAIINALLYFDAENTLVFCSTREAVRHLTSRLANRGFSVVSLSGELSQAERTNALQAMRDGRARVCVATDVAARGIDLPNLDLVIHADLPSNPETLLHRSGRTGRAGRKGVCAIVVPFHRRHSASRLLKQARLDAETMAAPGVSEIAERERDRMLADETLTQAIDEDERDVVAALVEAHGAEQIAAAFLRRYRQSRPSPEELSDRPAPAFDPIKGERPSERFSGGVWFRVSVGRRDKAEPRWLLPLICKAGSVTKNSVGSIRILENETRFEIAHEAAEAYGVAVRKKGALEKGVTIARVEGDSAVETPRARPHRARRAESAATPPVSAPEPSRETAERPKRPRKDWAPAAAKPERAVRTDPPKRDFVASKPRNSGPPKSGPSKSGPSKSGPPKSGPPRAGFATPDRAPPSGLEEKRAKPEWTAKPAAKETARTLKRKAKKERRKAEGRFV